MAALCAWLAAGPALAQTEMVDRLIYEEYEPEVGTFASRVLIGEHFVRLDDNDDRGDYLLFDRRSGLITSVVHERRSLFEVHPREVDPVDIPAQAGLREEVRRGPAEADYAGREQLSIRFIGADGVCGGAEVIASVAPRVVAALREYGRAIRANNAADLDKTPPAMRTPCYYIDNFHARDRALALGLPIVRWRADGRRSVLLEHDRIEAAPALFELPAYGAFSFTAPEPSR